MQDKFNGCTCDCLAVATGKFSDIPKSPEKVRTLKLQMQWNTKEETHAAGEQETSPGKGSEEFEPSAASGGNVRLSLEPIQKTKPGPLHKAGGKITLALAAVKRPAGITCRSAEELGRNLCSCVKKRGRNLTRDYYVCLLSPGAEVQIVITPEARESLG